VSAPTALHTTASGVRVVEPSGATRSFGADVPVRVRARLAGMNPHYWYPAEWSDRVGRGQHVEVMFWGESIAVYRGHDGQPAAVENRCAHRQIKLTEGHVRGCNLVCLYHGWAYDRDGRLVQMQHDDFGRKLPVIQIRAYPVLERYGLLWIFPGDPALAAEVPLPEIDHAEGPDRWASLAFDYTWAAHHSMVIDNLCNLTHLYVHGNWVPYAETTLAHHSREGDRIELRWHHTMRRDLFYPITKRVFEQRPGSGESDTAMVYDYPYQRALSNGRIRSCNFMLPIDAERTRVFSIQYWRGPRVPGLGRELPAAVMDRVATPFIRPITQEIFRQDGATVEAEQVALKTHWGRPIPEPNPAVRLFEQLTVDRWQAHVDAREGEGAPAVERRVKRL